MGGANTLSDMHITPNLFMCTLTNSFGMLSFFQKKLRECKKEISIFSPPPLSFAFLYLGPWRGDDDNYDDDDDDRYAKSASCLPHLAKANNPLPKS